MAIQKLPRLGREPLSTKLLPNSLAVFETVARLGSVSAAANHLGIAPSAISRHMANLEARLSLELFARTGNRLALTEDGRDLAATIRSELATIQERIVDLQFRRSGAVVLGCSSDTLMLWVMPRFDRIARQFDLDKLRMVTGVSYAEFDDPAVDLSIRFGEPHDWPGLMSRPLFPGSNAVVCAPALLARFPDLAGGSQEAILRAPLLHMGFAHDGMEDWNQWFGIAGQLPGPRFTNYQAITQAAIGGHGVTFAFGRYLDADLQAGRLVQIGAARPAAATHHLVYRSLDRPATRLLAKILEEPA